MPEVHLLLLGLLVLMLLLLQLLLLLLLHDIDSITYTVFLTYVSKQPKQH